MRRLSASVLALVIGAGAALALVSCGGGSDAALLPGATASQITANLDKVKELAQSGECVGAQDAAEEVSTQIDALGGVDPELKRSLREGAARLNEVVARCDVETTEALEPTTTSEETTESSEEETTEKKPSEHKQPTVSENTTTTNTSPTTPTTTAPPATTTTTPPTTTAPPPTEGGGTGVPPGGIAPGETSGGG